MSLSGKYGIFCVLYYTYTVFLLPCGVCLCYLPICSHLYELTWYIGDEDFQMGRIKLRKGRAILIAKGEVGAAKSSYCTVIPSTWQKTLKMIIIVTIDTDDIESYFLRCFRDTSFSACVLAKFVE